MNLGSVISYAGIVEAVYFEARTGKVYALDGGWATYAGETDPKSIPDIDIGYLRTGGAPGAGAGEAIGRQTLTPGFMAGIEALHTRFGRLPFADLFQPAIWYAEKRHHPAAGARGVPAVLRGCLRPHGRGQAVRPARRQTAQARRRVPPA
jgi:hypothetical protein